MMEESKHPGTGGTKSPLTSTRSRDEIADNVRAMRENESEPHAKPDPETVRERVRQDAEAHRTAHSRGDDLERAVPRAAAHDPARKDVTDEARHKPGRREAAGTDRRYRDDRDKTSAELEREVEYERQQLTRTLDQIRSRVSPGQMMDQAFGYAREAGGAEFARNLGRAVRDNPLPVVLVGASLGWLIASSGAGNAAHRGTHRDHDTGARASGLRDRASDMGASISDRAGHMADKATGLASSAREGVGHATHSASSALHAASETGGAVIDRARDTLHHTGDSARSAMHHASEYAQDSRMGVQRSFKQLAEEQPLALGALGIALGAVIAALLPPTRVEDRVMGPASDTLKDQVRESVQHRYEQARDVMEETVEDIAQEFEDRGISAQRVGDAAVEATHKAGDAAVEATQKVGDAAKAATKGAEPEASQQDKARSGSGTSKSASGSGKQSDGKQPGSDASQNLRGGEGRP